MSASIVIEPIYNNYCARVIDVILPIQQIEFGVPITLEGQPDLLDIETNYHKDGGGFWGALNHEELVGTIALMNVGHQTGVIRKMFVKKAYRGKALNIAQRLLESLIAYCKQQGITAIYLGTVDILKAACRFYERNGFVKIDSEALPSYFPRMKADNTFYRLNLINQAL